MTDPVGPSPESTCAAGWRAIEERARAIGLCVRPYEAADFDTLFALHREALGTLTSADAPWDDLVRRPRFQRWIGSHDVRVLTYEHRTIGMVGVEPSFGAVYFTAFELVHDWRGRGIGTHVFRAAMDAAAAHAAAVMLHVYDANPARHLFDRLGFVPADDGSAFGTLMTWPAPTPVGADHVAT
jgi:GNAT superfamily N-acetyltransferase